MFRLEAKGHCVADLKTLERNVAHALTLRLPVIEFLSPVERGPLAVVGGGHSAQDSLDTLRAWPGEIWAINGACRWLKYHDIDSILFSVDPEACLAELAQGCTRAILASHCAPEAFDALRGASVTIFHGYQWTPDIKSPLMGGSTSATRAPLPAILSGHHEVHYFGCEGSFRDTTHTFKDESDYGRQLIIRAGGKDYRTTMQFMSQTENLSDLIRNVPMFKDRSGGLLAAMIEHPNTWEVVAVSGELCQEMDPTALTEANRYKAA